MPIISIDFDGCIVKDRYPCIGEEMPGAIEAINHLHEAGFCIIINSCRAREQESEMKQWLEQHEVNYCHINENCRERVVTYRTDCRKISADCYLDDKNILSLDFSKLNTWSNMMNLIFMKFGDSQSRECE